MHPSVAVAQAVAAADARGLGVEPGERGMEALGRLQRAGLGQPVAARDVERAVQHDAGRLSGDGEVDLRAGHADLDHDPALDAGEHLHHGNRWVHARISAIESRLDIRTLAETAADELGANEIGRVEVKLQEPLPLAPYRQSRVGGALIVVDPTSHRTSGALLVAD